LGTTSSSARSAAYLRLQAQLAAERCVILDGGIATELQRRRPAPDSAGLDRELWGTWALFRAPHEVLDVHKA
jgi:S-methylmethionine-dependent homocysteine/selenocysteine methylase